MSVQAALTFIQQIRQPDKAQEHRALTQLQDAVNLGQSMGLTFNIADLQTAYRQDWIMRWGRYQKFNVK